MVTPVYQTPFDPTTRQCTGPSESVGAVPLDDLQALYGEPVYRSRSWLIYSGLCFGPVPMRIDRAVKSSDTAGTDRSFPQ